MDVEVVGGEWGTRDCCSQNSYSVACKDRFESDRRTTILLHVVWTSVGFRLWSLRPMVWGLGHRASGLYLGWMLLDMLPQRTFIRLPVNL